MTTVFNFLIKKKVKFLLVTDNDHMIKLVSKRETFADIIKKKKISFIKCKKLKLKNIKKYINVDTKGISLNSIWKFDKEIIKFFNGNLYNYHPADLPTERGAGCISWRILLEKKNFSLNIHRVEKGYDTGEIVFKKKITKNFKKNLPKKIYDYQSGLEKLFLEKFLERLISSKKKKLKGKIQKNDNSYYWPRLNSDIDGLINWNWEAKHIVSFIKAFSHPFNGAFSYIGKLKLRIFDASFHNSKIKFHPFQNGIIFRLNKESIYIAASNYYIKIPLKQIKLPIKNKEYLLGKRLK